jgi:bacillolysin/neutral peptidase B
MAVVELSRSRELVSVDAELAQVGGVSPLANLSPMDALRAIAVLTEVNPTGLQEGDAPSLVYFFHDQPEEAWHLAYFVRDVPAVPKEVRTEIGDPHWRGHGLGKSPRTLYPLMDYMVDAHSGDVIFYYPASPTAAGTAPQVPVRCKGTDEDNAVQQFYGRQNGAVFELFDPFYSVATYDLMKGDIANAQIPNGAVSSTISDFQSSNPAAVAAHVHATAVNQFYRSVLARDSVDNKGMTLISIVNATYPQAEPPPEWHNAVWSNNCMWYGQRLENGKFSSYSRYLDVIAHELTHGVTQFTSNLVYQGQSGALNESFSDIFGVIIKNWFAKKWNSPQGWDWEIGSGLGQGGLPLRDLSDPRRTADPDHMNSFLWTRADSGGVHTNSNIHNKAAYNLITAKDANGNYLFAPEESAVLYYLCLVRLNSQATFSKVLQVLIDVANTYYAGNPPERDRKIEAITNAYHDVGIQ